MPNQSQLQRPRVLLADDHFAIVQRVTTLLEATFEVIGIARTGREMVAEAMRLKPDVIVADISMPEVGGIEAVHELRELGSFSSRFIRKTSSLTPVSPKEPWAMSPKFI